MAIVWGVIFMVWFETEKKKHNENNKTTNTNTTRRHCGYDYRSIWSTWNGKEYMGLIDVLDVRYAGTSMLMILLLLSARRRKKMKSIFSHLT